ncbi:hypothetical protein BJX70DRAFT_393476 [Aspergillus crustosus]
MASTDPVNHAAQDVHLGATTCSLCRNPAEPATTILGSQSMEQNPDRYFIPFTVPPPAPNPSACFICVRMPKPIPWLHAYCYDVIVGTYTPSTRPTMAELRDLTDALRYLHGRDDDSGDEASAHEGLLSSWTRGILSSTFRQDLFQQLPVEIQLLIAKFTGPVWYLVLLGETRRLLESMRMLLTTYQYEYIDLSQPIFFIRLDYQGRSYMSRISSIPLALVRAQDQCRLDPPAGLRRIVISSDHIGVRAIQLLAGDMEPVHDSSPWFMVYDLPHSDINGRVTCDGLFIRSVKIMSTNEELEYTTWSVPDPPKLLPQNTHRKSHLGRLDYLRLRKNIKGLLVCCTNFGIIGIHAFSNPGPQFHKFAKRVIRRALDDNVYWIFCPLNPGEVVIDAWVHRFNGVIGPGPQRFLLISTSRGRLLRFEPHLPPGFTSAAVYESLRKEGDGAITGFVHNGLDPERTFISTIGVICDSGRLIKDPEQQPPPTRYTAPRMDPVEGLVNLWFMTHAALRGLRSVQVCRDEMQEHHPCLGLILHYADGHTEAVGQIRWDRDISDHIFQPISMEFSVLEPQLPGISTKRYVKNVAGCNAVGAEWRRLPQQGSLVWWFGRAGNEVEIHPD